MRKRVIAIVISLLLTIGLIGFALLYTPASSGETNLSVSAAQLAANDGLSGHACWVAVDGTVYAISGFSNWEMGRHTPSNGKATCGKDLSSVINESPHGKSVLQLLRKVGTLQ